MSLEVTSKFIEDRDVWIFFPEGDLDIYTTPKFREEVMKSFKEVKGDIELDCKDLKYVDSTGLGALISILKNVKEYEKNVYLVNVKPNIRKLFDITQLDKLFIIRGEDNE